MLSLFGVIWGNKYGRAVTKTLFWVIVAVLVFLIAQVIVSVSFG